MTLVNSQPSIQSNLQSTSFSSSQDSPTQQTSTSQDTSSTCASSVSENPTQVKASDTISLTPGFIKPESVQMDQDVLERQKILITGCSSGIGKATAKYFVDRDWQVFACIRNPDHRKELEGLGCSVKICDVSNPESIRRLFTDPELESLNCVYLNSGFGYVAAVEDLELEAFREQIEVNSIGQMLCLQEALKIFQRQGFGRLLYCSSLISFSPIPYRAAYGGSKALMDYILQCASIENRNPNIHFSILCPGPVETNFRATALNFFNKNVNSRQSQYADDYQTQTKRMQTKRSNFAVSPEQVAAKIWKIFHARKPKFRYLICKPAYLLYFLKRILPESWFMSFLRWSYKLEK